VVNLFGDGKATLRLVKGPARGGRMHFLLSRDKSKARGEPLTKKSTMVGGGETVQGRSSRVSRKVFKGK